MDENIDDEYDNTFESKTQKNNTSKLIEEDEYLLMHHSTLTGITTI